MGVTTITRTRIITITVTVTITSSLTVTVTITSSLTSYRLGMEPFRGRGGPKEGSPRGEQSSGTSPGDIHKGYGYGYGYG